MTELSHDRRPLFAYGTLMFPAVIKSVIGRIPDSRRAVIKGYRRLQVTGESFPGLIRESLESVEGIVYADIVGDEWEQLTAFEDDFYELQQITVECLGASISAFAYIVPPSRKSLLSDKTWNRDFFRKNHLAGFACQRRLSIQLEGQDGRA